MTLEEKVGQMLLFGWRAEDEAAPSPSEGYPGTAAQTAATSVNAHARKLLTEWKVGGVILMGRNVESPTQVARLHNDVQALCDVPVFFSTDQEGGHVCRMKTPFTMMPGAMPLGATGDEQLAFQAAKAVGEELTAIGVNLDFAPDADVNNNPDNPIIGVRSYGADPAKVAGMVAAQVKGYLAGGAIPCAKHFPGHGDTAVDSHLGLATIPFPMERLSQVELVPFQAAIAAGAPFIMTAHIIFEALDPDRPATLSPKIINGLLREELGFRGVVITDCMEMKGIVSHYGIAEAAVMAVEAGVDICAACHTPSRQEAVRNAILDAVRSGRISESRIDESVARILACKEAFRLEARRTVDVSAVPKVVGSEAHRAVEREIARRSVTLVKDEAGRIPLPVGRIAVIGPKDPAEAVVKELSALRPGAEIVAAAVGPAFTDDEVAAARSAAKDAAAVVLLTKHKEPWTAVPQDEAAQASLANELSSGPLVVAAIRNPYDIRNFPGVPTYLATMGYTAASLKALAEVLTGAIAPQGRLPVSLPDAPSLPDISAHEDTTKWGF
ncbi:MAG TPA: beta-N-acetylhexosaminidase [Armatimonadota bacterium]